MQPKLQLSNNVLMYDAVSKKILPPPKAHIYLIANIFP